MDNKTHKALILGRISLVRSIGRERIPVVLAREGKTPFERFSRYTKEFICLPNLSTESEKALDVLEEYGQKQEYKPVAFLNGESDVLLFSNYRDRLSKYYKFVLAQNELIQSLVDKNKFAQISEEHDISSPRTIIPQNREECLAAARSIGYPCILKPIRQRLWHVPEILDRLGLRKAILLDNEEQLKEILDIIPPISGQEMVQEYVPGPDANHFDYHAYIDKNGKMKAAVVGHKIRTYPIHFGQGCYTHYVDDKNISAVCEDALKKLGYIGAANINTKRHAKTGKDYILEINPRFSLWTIFDSICGLNLPLLQYYDSLDMPVPSLKPHGLPRRWLWFNSDFKAIRDYRKCGEISFWQGFRSYFNIKGKIEFHVFAWDDPLPLMGYRWQKFMHFKNRVVAFLKKIVR